jgi:hypothetical protein
MLAAGQLFMVVVGYTIVKSSRQRFFGSNDYLEAVGVLAVVASVAYALLFF